MPDLSRLQAIHTFPMLVNYLRDELEWPITPNHFEDLTFEYQPEELGIEKKYSNLIKNIRQLRPLTTNQPWGVFFINFDKEKLPVVMLRRILGALVVKKRASGQSFNRPSWLCNDLLFISTYGEETSRSISFGHFREREVGGLPTLRVVGWDKDSTQLRMEDAQLRLAERLRYPEDTSDLENWRETWSSAFKLRPREVITTSKALATRLAEIALSIRQSVGTILEIENENGPMRELLKSFQENLLHDLTEDGFADTYAQTLTYGLLSEKMIASLEGTSGSLASIKLTNPFLSELVDQCRAVGREQQQIDFDELGVGELEELLDNQDTKLDEVLKDFGRTATGEDPVLHFYELFLSEYNPQERKQKGVFYTPKPVVSYIVRSVHELLQAEFGLEDGLADTTTWGDMANRNEDLEIPEGMKPEDPFVQILDPATGTATFLVETIGVIYQAMIKRWEAEGKLELEYQALWNDYVPKYLLPRLHGYELMMAPYAIAHMKIGIKLYETGYRFKANERARIYLSNALEPPSDIQAEMEEISPALAHEAKAVNEIKHHKRFTVVIGNPPYSNLSANLTAEARDLVEPYKFINGERLHERGALSLEKNLNDDYVKFIRLGQLTTNAVGVAGLVTNNGFMGNPTLRGMRWGLLQSYNRFSVLNLLGYAGASTRKDESVKDENVFDIANAGVAIQIGVSMPFSSTRAVHYGELIGSRGAKYTFLSQNTIQDTDFVQVYPDKPFFLFEPIETEVKLEYELGIHLLSLFRVNSTGIRTLRDGFVVDFDEEPLLARVMRFRDSKASDENLCAEMKLAMPGWWRVAASRQSIAPEKDLRQHVKRLNYRPFDVRRIFYHGSLVGSPRLPVMQHMEPRAENLGLHICRQLSSPEWQHALVTRGLTDDCYVSNRTKERGYTIPLNLRAEPSELGLEYGQANCDLEPFQVSLHTKDSAIVNPDTVFNYVYAILFSPDYRKRYLDFLKRDFPRIPLLGNLELFRVLTQLGGKLVAYHLMESPKVKKTITKFVGPKDLIGATDPTVEKASYSNETVWLDKNQTIGFEGVPEEVWNFHIGGYQVCEKWLKDRQAKGGKNPRSGRVLTKEDRDHYQGIVVSISETIRIMAEIDQVIDQHGGWPDAFQTKDSNEVPTN